MSERIASLYAEIGADTSGLEAGLKRTQEGTKGVVGSFTELSSALGLVQQGAQVAGQVFEATVGKTLAYADQVRGLSQAFSISAEESSKLIQVADDLGVSVDTLKVGFRGMAQNGIAPSLESLKALGVQYRAIQDPAERAQFAMKNLGKAGLDLSPILLADASALDASAKSAQETGQVMSGQAVDSARALQVSIDNMTDSVEGMTYKFSEGAIPELNRWTDAIGGSLEKMNRWQLSLSSSQLAMAEQEARTTSLGMAYFSLRDGLEALGKKTVEVSDKREYDRVTTNAAKDAQDAWAASSNAANQIQASINDGLATHAQRLAADAVAADVAAKNIDAAAKASDALKTSQQSWVDNTSQGVISALEKAGVKGNELFSAYAGIDEALGTHLNKDAAVQESYDLLAKNLATGKINADQFKEGVKQLAEDGMPKAQKAFDDSGLAAEATQKAFGTLDNFVRVTMPAGFLTGSGSAADFGKALLKQTEQGSGLYVYGVGVQSLTTDVNNLSTAIRNVPELQVPNFPNGGGGGIAPPPPGPGGANGLDMIVPPGYPNDSFNVRAQSGERVQITQPGQSGAPIIGQVNVYNDQDVEVIAHRVAAIIGAY